MVISQRTVPAMHHPGHCTANTRGPVAEVVLSWQLRLVQSEVDLFHDSDRMQVNDQRPLRPRKVLTSNCMIIPSAASVKFKDRPAAMSAQLKPCLAA